MIRAIFWGVILFMGWQAYKILKDQLFSSENNRVNGQATNKNAKFKEEDILDADFKDIKKVVPVSVYINQHIKDTGAGKGADQNGEKKI